MSNESNESRTAARIKASGPARESLRYQPDGVERKPPWLKVKLGQGEGYGEVRSLVKNSGLHTVCQSASCPNMGECWSHRTLTIMILGEVCTRSCGFCDVFTGRPAPPDADEPRRVAEALASLKLRYTVITSVDRDELEDGGARHWAETIRRVREACPAMRVEVLVPDFKGNAAHIQTVLDAGPHVFAHNVETVPRLHAEVRPQADYARSLAVLDLAKRQGAVSKSGLMLGLGERDEEVVEVMAELAKLGLDILSLGQYLRPSKRHLPIERWVHPDAFAELKAKGEALGIGHVEAGPLVRSSYRADQQAARLYGEPTER